MSAPTQSAPTQKECPPQRAASAQQCALGLYRPAYLTDRHPCQPRVRVTPASGLRNLQVDMTPTKNHHATCTSPATFLHPDLKAFMNKIASAATARPLTQAAL